MPSGRGRWTTLATSSGKVVDDQSDSKPDDQVPPASPDQQGHEVGQPDDLHSHAGGRRAQRPWPRPVSHGVRTDAMRRELRDR